MRVTVGRPNRARAGLAVRSNDGCGFCGFDWSSCRNKMRDRATEKHMQIPKQNGTDRVTTQAIPSLRTRRVRATSIKKSIH